MTILFRNNVVSTLASGILITDNTVNLPPGEGSRFPNPSPGQYFIITVQNGAAFEIMHCTARTGDVLTVVRGREDTSAQTWTAGSSVTMRITAGCFDAFVQQGHTHTTAQIVGLDAALASRAPLLHTHPISDVVALTERLTPTPTAAVQLLPPTDNTLFLTPVRGYEQTTARLATLTEAEAGTNPDKLMTPLRTAQAIAAASLVRPDGSVPMTGQLTLPGSDPTNPNHATRKAYVDTQVTNVSAQISTRAPMPQSPNGVGQVVVIQGSSYTLPSGGTWFVFRFVWRLEHFVPTQDGNSERVPPSLYSPSVLIAAGGTAFGSAPPNATGTPSWIGFAWRIA
jgi:hypothetical protein